MFLWRQIFHFPGTLQVISAGCMLAGRSYRPASATWKIQACTVRPEFYTDSGNQTRVLMLAQKAPYLLGCLLSPFSCDQNQQIKSDWVHERQRGRERQREYNTEKGCLELKDCLQNSFK